MLCYKRNMPAICVSPLSRLQDTLRTSGAKDVLTLTTHASDAGELSGFDVKRRRIVEFADITEPREGYRLAEPVHMAEILDFIRTWDRKAPLVIHCFAGISRSTAASYIAACALMPERDEAELAAELRALSPSATPNSHLIRLADDMLQRQGRMTAAIHAIGRGADAYEGNFFTWPMAAQSSTNSLKPTQNS